MGYIYFAKHKNIPWVKIGMSETKEGLNGRLQSFRTYSPTGLEVLGVMETDNPRELESILHEKYKYLRIGGEFFNIDKIIVDSIISNNDINEILQNVINSMTSNQKKQLIIKAREISTTVDIITRNFDNAKTEAKKLILSDFDVDNERLHNMTSSDIFQILNIHIVGLSLYNVGSVLRELGFERKPKYVEGQRKQTWNIKPKTKL